MFKKKKNYDPKLRNFGKHIVVNLAQSTVIQMNIQFTFKYVDMLQEYKKIIKVFVDLFCQRINILKNTVKKGQVYNKVYI